MLFVVLVSWGATQEGSDGILTQLVPLLNSLAVWLAVKGVTALKKFAPGWILGILVPGFSALGAWLAGMISPDSGFLITMVVGFGSTFINEAIKKLNTKKS